MKLMPSSSLLSCFIATESRELLLVAVRKAQWGALHSQEARAVCNLATVSAAMGKNAEAVDL